MIEISINKETEFAPSYIEDRDHVVDGKKIYVSMILDHIPLLDDDAPGKS